MNFRRARDLEADRADARTLLDTFKQQTKEWPGPTPLGRAQSGCIEVISVDCRVTRRRLVVVGCRLSSVVANNFVFVVGVSRSFKRETALYCPAFRVVSCHFAILINHQSVEARSPGAVDQAKLQQAIIKATAANIVCLYRLSSRSKEQGEEDENCLPRASIFEVGGGRLKLRNFLQLRRPGLCIE